MDLRHLNALIGVADHGSFSSAAYALDTVQSNISAHVARLEKELDAVLVDRSTGTLTEEGQVVVARGRRVREELDAMIADVAGLRHEVAGTGRVGMIGTTARWLTPCLLERVGPRHPRLRLVVMEGTTTTLVPQLNSGHLDLALLSLPLSGGDLAVTPLFEEDLFLVVASDQSLGNEEAVDLADLAKLDLLLPCQGTAFRDELDAAVRPAGITLSPKAEIDGVRLIASLTFEGYGPAVLPATAVPRVMRAGWRTLTVKGMPRRVVGVAQRRRGLPSAPARVLIDMLHELVNDPEAIPAGLHPRQLNEPERPRLG